MYRVRPLRVSLLLMSALHAGAYQAAAPAAIGRIEARPSPETVTAWETGLQSDPDNVQVRASVLTYYRTYGPVEKYFPQALWMVQHHPESPYAPLSRVGSSGSVTLPDTDLALI